MTKVRTGPTCASIGLAQDARDMEAGGRARATTTRRLRTIAGFSNDAVEGDLLEHSPAAHVRPAGS